MSATSEIPVPERQILIVGPYGVLGTGVVDAVAADPRWGITTAARRPAPTYRNQAAPPHISVDLMDREGTTKAFSSLNKVTDLVYAAYVEKPTMAETSYGGSLQNRSRFLLQVMEALVSVWGGHRVAVRIAPGGRWNGMSDSDPDALFDYVANELNQFGLAYLHIIEPRVSGNVVTAEGQYAIASARLRKIFNGRIIAAGGFEPDTAEEVVEKGDADLVAFGRHFLSNPDLPKRIQLGLPLNAYDRNTFYTFDAHGYTDYPFYGQQSESVTTAVR
jgi:NADH:flavin oxidoreductase / NADH oxidase family